MWFLISYNRPDKCRELLEQIKRLGQVDEGLLVVNGGEVEKYRDIVLPDNWKRVEIENNLGLLGASNEMFKRHPNEPWYGFITDDEYPHTPGWSERLVKEAGRWNIAHGNTHWQSHIRIHGAPVIGGELLRAVGYVSPPGLWHWYGDDVWEYITHSAGLRRFIPEVYIEHRHWMNGMSVKDKTHESSESMKDQDHKIFTHWVEKDFSDIMGRVFRLMARDTGNKEQYEIA